MAHHTDLYARRPDWTMTLVNTVIIGAVIGAIIWMAAAGQGYGPAGMALLLARLACWAVIIFLALAGEVVALIMAVRALIRRRWWAVVGWLLVALVLIPAVWLLAWLLLAILAPFDFPPPPGKWDL